MYTLGKTLHLPPCRVKLQLFLTETAAAE